MFAYNPTTFSLQPQRETFTHKKLKSSAQRRSPTFYRLCIVRVELAWIQTPLSESCCSLSYLNLAKLSHTDFLFSLLDEEAPNIGAIAELTLIKMEIKAASPLHGQACGRWKARASTCAAILLAQSLVISRSPGPQRLPSLSFNSAFQHDLSSCQTFRGVIWVCAKLHASKPVERWHSC